MAFVVGSISSLCKQMEKEGAAEGGSNRPDSNSSAPDLNEVKAITAAKQAVEAEKSSFSDSLVAAERQCSEIRQRIEALEAACSSHLGHDLVESAFRGSLAKHDHSLTSSCADEMETRAALNAFRAHNQIKDPARYPDDRFFHFSVLILFIAIETGVNAFFYEGSSGLLGGAFVAFAVSVINMGIAAILGALFRYSNLPKLKHKLVGYGALLGFVLAGFVLNLIFSTFRIQYQIVQLRVIDEGLHEPSTAMLVGALRTAVVDAFSVFQLNFPAIDFMSFTLFFVGFGCSVIAFWKGYTFDDRHPGHGDMDRRHKAAERAYDAAKKQAFDDAYACVCQMDEEVERLRNSIVSEQRNASALKAQAQSSRDSFASACATIQGELDLVIDAYRAANRATRATSPPQYFSEKPSVIPSDDGSERLAALITRIDEVSSLAKSLADSHASRLGERHLQIRQKINDLVEQEFQKQMEAVRVRAQNSISARGQIGA
jgi:hypothetical protein